MEAPGRLRVQELPDPQAGPADVVIRVRAALTCGTDLKAYHRGHPKMPCPTPFGHEFSGQIVEAGSRVQRFRRGEAVMSANTGPCQSCFFCQRDQENLCETIMEEMVVGAYAEYVRIPERVLRVNVYPKPDELPFEHACLLEPLSSICFGLEQLPAQALRADATALLIGAGPIALLWIVALKAAGVGTVVVSGRRPVRLEAARRLGADLILSEMDDLQQQLEDATQGRGADLVIECTGRAEVWQTAPAHARRGGTVVLFGGCVPGARVSFDAYRLHYDGVGIISPFHFRPRDVAAAYRLLTEPGRDWSPLISSWAGLDEVPALFERLGHGNEVKCAILP